jgi:hypothetical protein
VSFRRANAQEAKSTVYKTDTLIEFRASTLLFFLKKRGFSGFRTH